MNYSVALTSSLNKELSKHLLREDDQEDLCFALWYPSFGKSRKTALLKEIILPKAKERQVHGNASFNPQYFERAIGLALQKKTGLAFLHSHLGPGWQGMSRPDVIAEEGHAPAVQAATGLPFVGLTLATDNAWSARFWIKVRPRTYKRFWCETVRVIGANGLEVTFMDKLLPPPSYREELKRTISAWGEKSQQKLARLRMGIIGVGSVGSIVAESLARMGINHIKLIDFDIVKKHNLDRLLHATLKDASRKRFKTNVISDAIQKSATAERFVSDKINFSITEENGLLEAMDCDLLFCCVDKPWPRSVLNYIAYAHLIPVIDGGIGVSVKRNGTILSADWKAHIACPTRKCLECLEQYDPGLVQMEREGYLDDPSYIQGLPDNHILKRNENVFSFSLNLASLEILQMLSMVINPLGISNVGEQNFHFITGTMDVTRGEHCGNNCLYPTITALGDRVGWTVTGKHLEAERTRNKKKLKFPLSKGEVTGSNLHY